MPLNANISHFNSPGTLGLKKFGLGKLWVKKVFGKYTFKKYIFRKYTFGKYTFGKYTLCQLKTKDNDQKTTLLPNQGFYLTILKMKSSDHHIVVEWQL